MEDWRATSSTASAAATVFSRPSSIDDDAVVRVQERTRGWHTIGTSGGAARSIYHGVYRVDGRSGLVDPRDVGPSDYVRTMAAIALASMVDRDGDVPLRCLHFGFGAGGLQRLVGHHVPGSTHLSVELDAGVVAAAAALGLADALGQRVERGDALRYGRPGGPPRDGARFDCIFVDVFDGANVLPPGFYADAYLRGLRDRVLAPGGVVVHNFHEGTSAHAARLEGACAAYGRVFRSCRRVAALNRGAQGGNTIFLASTEPQVRKSGKSLYARAEEARVRWGLRFDAAGRVAGARRFGSL